MLVDKNTLLEILKKIQAEVPRSSPSKKNDLSRNKDDDLYKLRKMNNIPAFFVWDGNDIITWWDFQKYVGLELYDIINI